jgi:cell division protein FtsZ
MFTKLQTGRIRSLFQPPAFGSGAPSDARIGVVGVGGGGGNAVNTMAAKGIGGVDLIAVNTDSQVLASNKAGRRIQAGREATGGLGAGARPEIGAEAVEESREQIEQALAPYDMVFITAGMGGGTGTGGAPVVASIAREMEILTVGIVTTPFACESPRRMQAAKEGIAELRKQVDTLLVIPNERLLDLASERTSLVEAFRLADQVLCDATRGISDLITQEGLINLDFADVETTMKDGGTALLGMSSEQSLRQHDGPRVQGGGHLHDSSRDNSDSGQSRAKQAALEAISSPLFDGRTIRGADKVVVNVTGGPSLGIREAMAAADVIQQEAGDACEVIFGAVIDEAMEGHFQVTVIATGLEDNKPPSQKPSKRAVRISADELAERKKRHASGDGASGDGAAGNAVPEPAASSDATA